MYVFVMQHKVVYYADNKLQFVTQGNINIAIFSAASDPDLKLTPYWWEAAPLRETEAVDIPGRADVAIVDAG